MFEEQIMSIQIKIDEVTEEREESILRTRELKSQLAKLESAKKKLEDFND